MRKFFKKKHIKLVENQIPFRDLLHLSCGENLAFTQAKLELLMLDVLLYCQGVSVISYMLLGCQSGKIKSRQRLTGQSWSSCVHPWTQHQPLLHTHTDTHWHMMYMRSEEVCFAAVARFSLCIASCTHLGCYVRCSWRQSATSAHSRCISDTGNAGSDCRLIFDSVFAQWKHAGSKWVFTEIHFRLFAWKTSLSLCFLQSDDAWMFMCLWVCVCLSLPHNFTVSLGLTINPASFIVTTRPINQCDTRRGDRPPVSCTFYQKIYFWSSLNRECGQFCMQRNNCEFFIAWFWCRISMSDC